MQVICCLTLENYRIGTGVGVMANIGVTSIKSAELCVKCFPGPMNFPNHRLLGFVSIRGVVRGLTFCLVVPLRCDNRAGAFGCTEKPGGAKNNRAGMRPNGPTEG